MSKAKQLAHDGTEPADGGVTKKAHRGFAAMKPEKQKAIASMGGKAAHERGHAHEFTEEEARTAGQKGGQATSADREHMARIGRRGGLARRQKAQSPA